MLNHRLIDPPRDPEKFVEAAIEFLQKHAKDKKVFCALSGGIDSSATYLLTRYWSANKYYKAQSSGNISEEGRWTEFKNTFRPTEDGWAYTNFAIKMEPDTDDKFFVDITPVIT